MINFPCQTDKQKHGNLFHIFLLISCFCALFFKTVTVEAKGSKAHPFRKINPSEDLSAQDKWVFTLESNTYQSTVYLNPVLDFPTWNGWDLQVASYNIPVYGGGAQNYEWDSYLNLSKTFVISSQFKAIAGTQNGTTAFSTTHQLHNVDYALGIYEPLPAANIHAGPYWGNKALTVTSNVLGYTGGFSFEPLKNRVTILGDYYSGQNNLSGAIVNVMYRIVQPVQVYIGVGVPAHNSGNEFYGAVGFSLSSK